MRLHLLTWNEVEDYLKSRRDIIIPIGSTEQHGPNGLIGTDAICAEEIAWRVGATAQALVAPTIAVGMAQHHLGFPGSMTLRPSTLIAIIKDMVDSLAVHGFERFYFLNGHGGNIATTTAAFSEIYAARSLNPKGNYSPLACTLKNWWETKAAADLSRNLYPDVEGSHATPSEVAVTQAVYPAHIKKGAIMPTVAPKGSFTDAADYRRNFPDGRIGSNPGLATPEAGQKIIEAVSQEIAHDYKRWAGLA